VKEYESGLQPLLLAEEHRQPKTWLYWQCHPKQKLELDALSAPIFPEAGYLLFAPQVFFDKVEYLILVQSSSAIKNPDLAWRQTG